jgi:hypothetical protein
MLQLKAEFFGPIDREHEQGSLSYGSIVIFKISSHSLNRGGRGLNLRNIATNELLVTTSRYYQTKSFFKQVVQYTGQCGFSVTLEELVESLQSSIKRNIEKQIQEIESVLVGPDGLNKEVKALSSRLHNTKLLQSELQYKLQNLKQKLQKDDKN